MQPAKLERIPAQPLDGPVNASSCVSSSPAHRATISLHLSGTGRPPGRIYWRGDALFDKRERAKAMSEIRFSYPPGGATRHPVTALAGRQGIRDPSGTRVTPPGTEPVPPPNTYWVRHRHRLADRPQCRFTIQHPP
jgi:hypothetical protein